MCCQRTDATGCRPHPVRAVDAVSPASLHFPDRPKLELDQLIEQLVDRAQDVKRAQGRLRSLLRAIETITSDLALEAVLHNVVQAARELASAKFGALGVIGDDGLLERFVPAGFDEETVRRIGGLPQGNGLLGALISDPRPIRLARMSEDARSFGFPAGHPPMTSFLGVPIRVRDDVYGNLYLTECEKGEFSVEDEELVGALAQAAGTAIRNARLYDESERQQRWLQASVEIGAQMLSASGEDPLRTIARHAIDVADADTVTVGLLTPDGAELVVEVAFGVGSDELVGQRFPLGESLAGQAIDEWRPLLATAPSDDARASDLARVMDAGPLMILPLGSRPGSARGALSLVRERGRPSFRASDLDMAAGFASHASVALELADSRTAEQKVVLLEDRERIARDLHDHVIQELFAIGLGLESAAALLGPDDRIGQRVRQRVEDIDRTIRRIRTSIFALRAANPASAAALRQRVLEVCSELTSTLGFPPHVAFAGPVDLVGDAVLVDEVAAVVREVLTHVARYAGATTASVDISATTTQIVITVSDNGSGYSASARSTGMANLRVRAQRCGGAFDVSSGPAGGTVHTWKAAVR